MGFLVVTSLHESRMKKAINEQLKFIETYNVRVLFYRDKDYPPLNHLKVGFRMKNALKVAVLFFILGSFFFISGCGVDEVTVRKIAHEEAMKTLNEYKQSFVPEKFGFGVPWEKDFNYAQGVKVGNLIFVAGQLAHSQKSGEDWEYGKVTVGKNFEEQFRQTLENIKAVLAHYGATMDDVVFLQNFIDPEAGGKKAGNYGPAVRKLINEYFPKGHHAMTNVQITNLFGQEQFIETNAIAVVRK